MYIYVRNVPYNFHNKFLHFCITQKQSQCSKVTQVFHLLTNIDCYRKMRHSKRLKCLYLLYLNKRALQVLVDSVSKKSEVTLLSIVLYLTDIKVYYCAIEYFAVFAPDR